MEHKWKLEETEEFREFFEALAIPPMDTEDALECAAWNAWKAAKAGGKLNDRELATVIAALRFWQMSWPLDPNESDLATDEGRLEALTDDEIDELCERIN